MLTNDHQTGTQPATVDMTSAPAADSDVAGTNWQSLGTFTNLIIGLRVALSSDDTYPVSADVVMVDGAAV